MALKYGPYSPSRLDTAICGYAFYRQYVDSARAARSVESLPQARGSAVHEIFEKITKRLCAEKDAYFNPKEISTWAEEAVHAHPAAYQEIDAIFDMARRYVDNPPHLLTSDAGTELRLAVKQEVSGAFVECDYEDKDALARGRADIFLLSDDTTTALVYDHKTQPNKEEADTFQLGFYAWVIAKTYPFLKEIRTILHFARYGQYSQPVVWDIAKMMEPGGVQDEILTRISIIENKQSWEATPHQKCQYCPFMTDCPVMKEFIQVDEHGCVRCKKDNLKIMGDTQKALYLAGLINVMDEMSRTATKELREHVKNFGPIAIPGKVYEFRGESKIDWDSVNKTIKPKAIEIFEKHGVDPKFFMGFSQTFSNGIWLTENEPLVKELSELFPRKLSTEFRGYKA